MITTADFIVMPYEAAPTSENLLSSLHRCGRLGPIWIDEVRCAEHRRGLSNEHKYSNTMP